MGFLDILKGKKSEEAAEKKQPEEIKSEMTNLEIVCGDDRETYEALSKTMLLNPRGAGVSVKEAAQKAKEFEKQGDMLKARIWYEQAGGLAIYQADIKGVKEYFAKCKQLSPAKSFPILKIPERAVAKAQEYYQTYLKE